MNKKFTKVVVWILLLTFVGVTFFEIIVGFTSTAYAAEIDTTTMKNQTVNNTQDNTENQEKKEVLKFSLEEAIKYAKEKNHDILALNLDNSSFNYNLKSAKERKKDLEDIIDAARGTSMGVSSLSSQDSYLLRSGYTEFTLKNQEKVLELSKKLQEDMLDIFVESVYNKTLLAKIASESAVRNYDLVKSQLETAKLKFDMGEMSELQYKQVELELKSAEIGLLNANKSYDDAKMEFNLKLGLDLETEVILTSDLVKSEKVIERNEEKEKLIRDNNIALLSAQNSLANAKEYERYVTAYNGKNSTAGKSATVAREKAELELVNAENTFKKNLKGTYSNLDITKKTVDLMKQKTDLMQLVLGLTEIRKNAGMATENDVIKASLDFVNSQNDYYSMLDSYNILVGLFEKNIMD